MYGILTCTWVNCWVNFGKYSIHRAFWIYIYILDVYKYAKFFERIFDNSNPIPIVLHTNRYMAKQGFWLVLNWINWINWLIVDEPMLYIILNHVDGVHM